MASTKNGLSEYAYHPVDVIEDEDTVGGDLSTSKAPSQRRIGNALRLHLLFATIHIAILVGIVRFLSHDQGRHRSDLIYTPARSAIQHKVGEPIRLIPHQYHEDPFFGDPSPELDDRWLDRLRYATIRLSEDEFRQYNQSGVKLSDGSGYLATPTAYHDLHCLRMLHQGMYPEYYYPDENVSAQSEHGQHWRHCLHNLASAVMCNVDMTMRVMTWHPKSQFPSPIDHEHECVDWDAIEIWAQARYVDVSTPGLVVHP